MIVFVDKTGLNANDLLKYSDNKLSTPLENNYISDDLCNEIMTDLPQQKLNLINTLRAYPKYISCRNTLFSTKVNYILLCMACFFIWSTVQGQPSGLFDSDGAHPP